MSTAGTVEVLSNKSRVMRVESKLIVTERSRQFDHRASSTHRCCGKETGVAQDGAVYSTCNLQLAQENLLRVDYWKEKNILTVGLREWKFDLEGNIKPTCLGGGFQNIFLKSKKTLTRWLKLGG